MSTLELDIQITRNGVMVVHHDKRLNSDLCQSDEGGRVGNRPLAKVTYAEIADFDCGSRRARNFPEQELFPGARIPRLEEVLDLARAAPYPVWVSIEIKQPTDELPMPLPEVVEAVVSMIQEHGLEDRAIIQSKWGEVLAAVRDHSPQLERALVVRTAGAQRWVEEDAVTIVSRKHVFLDRGEVETLQRKGVRVIPWTVNKPEKIRQLLSWGVDGLITDYPDRARAILED